jgi:hypothetical protein
MRSSMELTGFMPLLLHHFHESQPRRIIADHSHLVLAALESVGSIPLKWRDAWLNVRSDSSTKTPVPQKHLLSRGTNWCFEPRLDNSFDLSLLG